MPLSQIWGVCEMSELLNYKRKSILELIYFPTFLLPYKQRFSDMSGGPLVGRRYHASKRRPDP